MLEQSSGTETTYESALTTMAVSNSPDEALISAVRDSIEDYLEQVCAPLVKYMPYAVRKERRREMRTHLESLMQAYVELGSAPEEAVSSALQQFGSPRIITRRWLREWEQTHLTAPTRSARPAMRWALRPFGAFTVGSIVAWCAFDPLWRVLGWTPRIINRAALIMLGLMLVCPLLVGIAAGFRARSRPVLGTLYAQALTLPLVPGALYLLASTIRASRNLDGVAEVVAGALVVAAPLGCLGAFCGSRLRHLRGRLRAAR